MKIILKTLAESEELCEAVNESRDRVISCSPEERPARRITHSNNMLKRDDHASTMLPAMHELVREMYEIMQAILSYKYHCIPLPKESYCGMPDCPICKARRLVERMENKE